MHVYGAEAKPGRRTGGGLTSSYLVRILQNLMVIEVTTLLFLFLHKNSGIIKFTL